MDMSTNIQLRSGWVTFAAVMAAVVGVYNILSGIAAIAEDELTEEFAEVLYGVDISAWGWFWLILGIVQLVVAYLIYVRSSAGLYLGLVWAFLNATLTVFIIFSYPLWALAILAIDVLIIYALCANAEEFGA
jgi:hypothetical protein